MSEAYPLNCLVLGKEDAAEFRDAAQWLRATCSVTRNLQDAPRVDTIVYWQSYPGEFSPHVANSLRRAAPLASQLVVLGDWCAGELRTGRPLPGVQRCSVGALPLRLMLQHPTPPRYATQTTADDLLNSSFSPASINALVAVAAKLRDEGIALRSALRSVGVRLAEPEETAQPITNWIVCGEDLNDTFSLAAAERCRSRWPTARGLLLLAGPQAAARAHFRSGGEIDLLGRPLWFPDLLTWLARSDKPCA